MFHPFETKKTVSDGTKMLKLSKIVNKDIKREKGDIYSYKITNNIKMIKDNYERKDKLKMTISYIYKEEHKTYNIKRNR